MQSDLPSVWPTEQEIVRKVAACFLNIREGVGSPRVIRGFEAFNVEGVEVGRWLTSDEAFGDGGDEIAGVWFEVGGSGHARIALLDVGRRREFADEQERKKQSARAIRAARIQHPEAAVENAIADHLRGCGHHVEQQVRSRGGIADIVDYTSGTVIECKAHSSTASIMQAVDQLDRYMPWFRDFEQAIGLPDVPRNPATSSSLSALGVTVFVASDDGVSIMNARFG